MQFPSTTSSKQLISVQSFGGMNQRVSSSLVADNESVLMDNFVIDNGGTIKKRKGLKRINGDIGTCIDLCEYNGNMFTFCVEVNKMVVYKLTNTDNTINRAKMSLSNDPDVTSPTGMFIKFNSELYLLTSLELYKHDGNSTFDALISTKKTYTPYVIINCDHLSGAGIMFEDYNLISSKFRKKYNVPEKSLVGGEQTNNKIFYTHAKIMDKYYCPTKCFYDGKELPIFNNEPVGVTTVTYDGNLVKGNNNIEFEYDVPALLDKKDKILKCTMYSDYGGQNDTRILLAGDMEHKNTMYRNGVLDATYFPENAFQNIGDSEEAITGFGKQYGCCLVFKENSIWRTEFKLDEETGITTYPVQPINDFVGCTYPNSIGLIENRLVFLNKNGLYTVYNSNERGETNVGCISETINKFSNNGFPMEIPQKIYVKHNYSGLTNSIKYYTPSCCEYDDKFLVASGRIIYVYDYKNKCWYMWTFYANIENIFCADEKLYVSFGKNITTQETSLYTFKDEMFNDTKDPYLYVDEEILVQDALSSNNVSARFISKVFDFGADERTKTIDRIFVSMASRPRNSCDISIITEDNKKISISKKINDLYGYNRIHYGRFTYNITSFPREMVKKQKIKKVVYFQLCLENFDSDNCEILGFDLRYKFNNYVK